MLVALRTKQHQMPVAVPTELLRQDQKLPHGEETLHYEQLQRPCFLDQLS